MLEIKIDAPRMARDMEKALAGTQNQIAVIVTRAMQDTAVSMKEEARAQITGAGMSKRMANTWRSEVYPQNRTSLNPASYLWSAAPEIIASMAGGTVIRPTGGRRYLAIPTRWCPKKKTASRGAARYMTPKEVETAFNQDLIFLKTEDGTLGAFVRVVKSMNRRRRASHWRQATARRLDQGRDVELAMMFTMVPAVRRAKRVDLDRIAAVGEAAFPRHLQDNWR